MRGYIYILTSEERPGVVKIGKTTVHPQNRCNRHNQDWYLSINSWLVQHWLWVENCTKAESEIHKILSSYNLGARLHKEAYKVSFALAKETVERVCSKYPAKSDQRDAPVMRKKKKLYRLIFSHIKKNGSISEHIINNKKIMTDEDFYNWISQIEDLL